MDIIAVGLSGLATVLNIICAIRAYKNDNMDATIAWFCAAVWSGSELIIDLMH